MQTDITPAIEAIAAIRSQDSAPECDLIQSTITALVAEGEAAAANVPDVSALNSQIADLQTALAAAQSQPPDPALIDTLVQTAVAARTAAQTEQLNNAVASLHNAEEQHNALQAEVGTLGVALGEALAALAAIRAALPPA